LSKLYAYSPKLTLIALVIKIRGNKGKEIREDFTLCMAMEKGEYLVLGNNIESPPVVPLCMLMEKEGIFSFWEQH